jgi:hypothetical protein
LQLSNVETNLVHFVARPIPALFGVRLPPSLPRREVGDRKVELDTSDNTPGYRQPKGPQFNCFTEDPTLAAFFLDGDCRDTF